MSANNWKVYILACADDTWYTGITNNLNARIEAHNQGTGARYTWGRRPVRLLGYWEYTSRSEASRAEYRIKQLSRRQKRNLLKTALLPNRP
ncbi:MAG: GIY-YIG nuclease family protein [Fidelibacterota bacterium]